MRWQGLRWAVLLCISLLFSMLPLPTLLSWCVPPWVLLLLIYMMMFEGLTWAIGLIVLMGCLLDVLQVGPLGEHVFALTLSLWLAALKMKRFRHFLLNQQMVFVGGLCLVYGLSQCFIDTLIFDRVGWGALLKVVTQSISGALCWPWVKMILGESVHPLLAKYR